MTEEINFSLEELVLIKHVFGSHSEASMIACGLKKHMGEIKALYNKMYNADIPIVYDDFLFDFEREYKIVSKEFLDKIGEMLDEN